MPYFEDLQPKYNDNSSQTRSEYNALAQAVKRNSNPQGGFGFQDGNQSLGQYDKFAPVPDWFAVKCAAPIPNYRVFTIKQDQDAADIGDPGIIEVEAYNGRNLSLLLTNGENPIAVTGGNGAGVAHVVDWYKPILLSIYVPEETPEDYPTPKPGYFCGPVKDTYQIALNGYPSLICLGLTTDEKFAYCIAAQGGHRWLVKPKEIIASAVSGEVVLWTGPAGGETATTDPEIIYKPTNRTGGDLAPNKFAEMVGIDGKLYVLPWECAATL